MFFFKKAHKTNFVTPHIATSIFTAGNWTYKKPPMPTNCSCRGQGYRFQNIQNDSIHQFFGRIELSAKIVVSQKLK